MSTRLAIVIVNFNGRGHLDACLRSLADAPVRTTSEIVVVDNASTDGSQALVSGFPRVRLIQLRENVGFSAGNNAGIRATSSDLVLLLNNDTTVPAGAIDRLVAALDADPAAAVAGPRLVDARGEPELSFGPMISPLGELRQKLIAGLHRRGFGPVRSWVDRTTRRAANSTFPAQFRPLIPASSPVRRVWDELMTPDNWPSWWRAVRKVETMRPG